MQRSLYPDGVVVAGRHLEFTEKSKAEEILARARDYASGGIVSGLRVDVDFTGLNLQVGGGWGYAPGGERVVSDQGAWGVPLADYGEGAVNYVVLTYTETGALPEPIEFQGGMANTRATAASRLSVLTADEWDAMPATSPDMGRDARDRALLLAVVTARGAGVALTQADIARPLPMNSPKGILASGEIPGIHIASVTPSTTVQFSDLAWTASTSTLQWMLPGGGPSVVLEASGEYTLSQGDNSITVQVSVGQLPTVDSVIHLRVDDLYAQQIPRASAMDIHHRSMVGTGQVSARNPHGLSLEDLGGSLEDLAAGHQEFMHSTGIWRGSNPDALSIRVDSSGPVHSAYVVPAGENDRIWIGGHRVRPTNFDIPLRDRGLDNQGLIYVYLWQDGRITSHALATTEPSVPEMNRLLQLYDLSGWDPEGTHTLEVAATLETGAVELSLNGGSSVSVAGAEAQMVRLYAEDGVRWVEFLCLPRNQWISNGTMGITLEAHPADPGKRIELGRVAWSGDATGFAGVGAGVARSPNMTVDKRIYGTTGMEVMTDDAIDELARLPFAETRTDGVVLPEGWQDSFRLTISGNTAHVGPGVAYIGGRRVVSDGGSVQLPASGPLRVTSDGFITTSGVGGVLLYEIDPVTTVATDLRLWLDGGGTSDGVTVGGAGAHFRTLEGAALYLNYHSNIPRKISVRDAVTVSSSPRFPPDTRLVGYGGDSGSPTIILGGGAKLTKLSLLEGLGIRATSSDGGAIVEASADGLQVLRCWFDANGRPCVTHPLDNVRVDSSTFTGSPLAVAGRSVDVTSCRFISCDVAVECVYHSLIRDNDLSEILGKDTCLVQVRPYPVRNTNIVVLHNRVTGTLVRVDPAVTGLAGLRISGNSVDGTVLEATDLEVGVSGLTVSDNEVGPRGSLALVGGPGCPSIDDVLISGNTVDGGSGHGIRLRASFISGASILGNVLDMGLPGGWYGISVEASVAPGEDSLSGVTIRDNSVRIDHQSSSGNSRCVFVAGRCEPGSVSVSGNHMVASQRCGGIYVDGSATISGNTIDGASEAPGRRGIECRNGRVLVVGNTVYGRVGTTGTAQGWGVHLSDMSGAVTVTDNVLHRCGIFVEYGSEAVADLTLTGNNVRGRSVGPSVELRNPREANVTLGNATISGNTISIGSGSSRFQEPVVLLVGLWGATYEDGVTRHFSFSHNVIQYRPPPPGSRGAAVRVDTATSGPQIGIALWVTHNVFQSTAIDANDNQLGGDSPVWLTREIAGDSSYSYRWSAQDAKSGFNVVA